MKALLETIEDMKPAYVHAMKLMNTANQPTADQKNNLVFYGLEPEPLEMQMEKEPEFCRDILETRIKMIFREVLKISRDIPFVTVYRFTTGNTDPDEVINVETPSTSKNTTALIKVVRSKSLLESRRGAPLFLLTDIHP